MEDQPSNQCPGLLSLQWPEFPAHPLPWKSFLFSLLSFWWHSTELQVRCKWRWGTKEKMLVSCKGLLSPLGCGQAASCKESSHKSSKLVGRLQMKNELSRQILQVSLWKHEGQPQNYHSAPAFSLLNTAGLSLNHFPSESHSKQIKSYSNILKAHRKNKKESGSMFFKYPLL